MNCAYTPYDTPKWLRIRISFRISFIQFISYGTAPHRSEHMWFDDLRVLLLTLIELRERREDVSEMRHIDRNEEK